MLRSTIVLASMLSASVYAKELKVKDAMIEDGYLFLESATQNRLISILGKTETIVASRIENTTTSGLPIRSWVIKTRWIDDPTARRAALQKVLESHPEWESYAKDREDLGSAYCSFRLIDPDIKVTQGDRTTALTSYSDLCTYVVHTKNDGDDKLLAAVADNTLIDSGVAAVTVRIPGATRTLLDAQEISEVMKSIEIDPSKSYTERQAGAYLGIALLQYANGLEASAQDQLLAPQKRSELLTALDQVFERLFAKVVSEPGRYRFQSLSESTPISIVEDQVIGFDPQAKE